MNTVVPYIMAAEKLWDTLLNKTAIKLKNKSVTVSKGSNTFAFKQKKKMKINLPRWVHRTPSYAIHSVHRRYRQAYQGASAFLLFVPHR